MSVKIPQYQQRTSPGGLGVVPHARAALLDDSMAQAGQRFASTAAGAIDHVARVNEAVAAHKAQQEAEDAKVWTAHAVAQAQNDMARSFVESQDAAQPGAPDFTQQFGDLFDSYTEDALGNAPNATSKKFLGEAMLRLRADMTGKALEYETGERRKWRVDTGKQAIDAVSASMAADPSRLPVVLAEQHAMIDSYAVPPEAKRAMHAYADEQIATAAVMGDIERTPDLALAMLSRRLGVEVSDVMPATAPASAREVQAKYEQIGASFGFETTSTVRSKAENAAANGVPTSQHLAERGTARDWSVKGKTPDQIAAFAAALRAEGFEVITSDHGTGPHVHAELPPAAARRSVSESLAANPEGEKTGAQAYDLLTVPQVVQLIGKAQSEREKQGTAFRSYISAREADDLAAYGDGKAPPDPLGPAEFIAAYGGVEGARRWRAYEHAQTFASDVSGFASKTPAEIAAVVNERAPTPGDGYADAAKAHAARTQAAGAVLQQRGADPIQFAMDNGLTQVQPLDFTNATAMSAGLKARVGLADTMNQKYGTGYTLLTKAEAAQMSQMLGGMTAAEKGQMLAGVRGALPDSRSYQSVMAVLRPDSPVTATAGSIMAVGSARTSSAGVAAVVQKLLVGEDLLNPPKDAKGGDGKPKFAMPPEADLRQAWTDYTGTAYAGSPDTEAASYQAFRAYYAAELAGAGDYTGAFNADAAERAAEAVTGGVVDVNESTIVLPWGQHEGYVIDSLRRGWEAQRTGAGLPSVPFEQISLQTVGDGVYAVTAGTGPIRGADGQPMLLRVDRYIPSEFPQVPTGP